MESENMKESDGGLFRTEGSNVALLDSKWMKKHTLNYCDKKATENESEMLKEISKAIYVERASETFRVVNENVKANERESEIMIDHLRLEMMHVLKIQSTMWDIQTPKEFRLLLPLLSHKLI